MKVDIRMTMSVRLFNHVTF